MEKKSTEEICQELMEIYNNAEGEAKERIHTFIACGSVYGREFLDEMNEYIEKKQYGSYLASLARWKKRLEEEVDEYEEERAQ